MLLNIGPDNTGAIPEPERERLEDIALWMQTHRSTIINTQPGLEPWQFAGPSTKSSKKIFLFLTAWPYESTTIRGIPARRVSTVTLITTGEELPFHVEIDAAHSREENPVGAIVIEVPDQRPDTLLPVVEVCFLT